MLKAASVAEVVAVSFGASTAQAQCREQESEDYFFHGSVNFAPNIRKAQLVLCFFSGLNKDQNVQNDRYIHWGS